MKPWPTSNDLVAWSMTVRIERAESYETADLAQDMAKWLLEIMHTPCMDLHKKLYSELPEFSQRFAAPND